VRVSSKEFIPPGAAAIHVSTNMVDVDFVVRDSRGHAIRNLLPDDFEVYDRGRKREFSGFSEEDRRAGTDLTVQKQKNEEIGRKLPSLDDNNKIPSSNRDLPRYVVLYFDDIHMPPGDFRNAQIAAERFLREGLAPDDEIEVFSSSGGRELSFTSDVPKILDTVHKLTPHPTGNQEGQGDCPRITSYQAYLISEVHDESAVKAAVQEFAVCSGHQPSPITMPMQLSFEDPATMNITARARQVWGLTEMFSEKTLANIEDALAQLAAMPGRRMLLLSSSGFLAGTLESRQDEIVTRAVRSGIVINALDAKGLYAEAPGPSFTERQTVVPVETFRFELTTLGAKLQETDAAMANLAQSTGGLFFHDRNDLDFGFRELGLEPETSYQLAFSIDDSDLDGKYHSLKVRMKTANAYYIQARPGYFAPTIKTAHQAPPTPRIDKEALDNDAIAEFPASVSSATTQDREGRTLFNVTVHVDLAQLQFQPQKDRQVQQLNFVIAIFTSEGAFVTGKRGEMDLALKADSFVRMRETGVNATLSLDAPPGDYRLRAVSEETVGGRIWATTQSVHVR
jgi:VWFA-related protein